MPTILKMNDIPIIDYTSIIELYDDDFLYQMILEYYTNTKQTDIFNFWKSRHSIDFEEDEDDVDDYNEDDNNMNLSLIKNMHLIFTIPINMILRIMKILLK